MYDIQTLPQPSLSLNLKLFADVELAQLGSSCKTLPADQRQQHPGESQPGSETAAWQWNRPEPKLPGLVSGQLTLLRLDVCRLTAICQISFHPKVY